MSEKFELPRIRMYGSSLSGDIDVFGDFNQQYVKKKTKIKKQKRTEQSLDMEEVPSPNKEGRYIIITELLRDLKIKKNDMFDLLDTFMGSNENSLLDKEHFVTGVSRITFNYSRDRSRELFNMLDRDFVGTVPLHQFCALVGFAAAERGSEMENILQAIISGIVWEKLFCVEIDQINHRGSLSTSNTSTPYREKASRNSREVQQGVGTSKASRRKALHKEKKKKAKRFYEEFLRTPLPLASVISILRIICPPDSFVPDGDIVEDPLEVFIAALYDIVRRDNQDKNKRGKGRSMLARRSDSIRRQASMDLDKSSSSDSALSSVNTATTAVASSDTPHRSASISQPSDVNRVKAVLRPHGFSDPPFPSPAAISRSHPIREIDGNDLALLDSPHDVKNALRNSLARSQNMHDVMTHGYIDVRDVCFEKLMIMPVDLCEFAASQYDFHIRLQTELFNWSVFAQKANAEIYTIPSDSEHMSDGEHSAESTAGSVSNSKSFNVTKSSPGIFLQQPNASGPGSLDIKRNKKSGINDSVKNAISDMMRCVL